MEAQWAATCRSKSAWWNEWQGKVWRRWSGSGRSTAVKKKKEKKNLSRLPLSGWMKLERRCRLAVDVQFVCSMVWTTSCSGSMFEMARRGRWTTNGHVKFKIWNVKCNGRALNNSCWPLLTASVVQLASLLWLQYRVDTRDLASCYGSFPLKLLLLTNKTMPTDGVNEAFSLLKNIRNMIVVIQIKMETMKLQDTDLQNE